MKTLGLGLLIASAWAYGFFAGTVTECNTRAYFVSQVTGSSYLQVLDGRISFGGK